MKPKRAREFVEAFNQDEKTPSLAEISEYVLYMSRERRFVIEIDKRLLIEAVKKIDGYLVRKDKPHFQGDEYHAHTKLDGGYEVSYGVSGRKRHSNKFPAHVPDEAKKAIATMLRVPVSLLDCFWTVEDGNRTLLVEVNEKPSGAI